MTDQHYGCGKNQRSTRHESSDRKSNHRGTSFRFLEERIETSLVIVKSGG
jgi:hypothetical protein